MKRGRRAPRRPRQVGEAEWKARWEAHKAAHDAFVRGDLAALKAELGHPPEFPNGPVPAELATGNTCLEYAIGWSPLLFIRTLLELGADPNFPDPGGFPPLIGALSAKRQDRQEVLELLLAFGADIQQRGINDYTPLHYAVDLDDPEAIRFLIAHGADPQARTRIDNCETPLELAQHSAAAKRRVKALKALQAASKI